ncbi:MAG: pyridoxal phosphate-dependent aminotransferase [Tissierellales bacterium]|nr:pyridoxal phosphate-dependent aminotransferase [Tissierellales bacterium]
MFAKRVQNMTPSATIEITSKIAELKKQGVEILSFNIGEPDFDTPENIRDKGKEALDLGHTRYTPAGGTIDLREEIAKKLLKENNLEYTYQEIIVSSGAKQALMNALLTLCEEGDEVIIPSPYWVSYIEMVKLTGAKPVLVDMEESDNFNLNVEKIKESISDKTKCIMINTPNNPTGAIYTETQLREIGNLCVENDIFILSDEIYEKLIYDGEKHVSIGTLSQEIKDKTILINGVSKSFAMTGWRIGYAAGPKDIVKAMTNLQGHMTTGPNAPAQYASLEAFRNSNNSVEKMVVEFDKRRKYLVDRLNNIQGITCNLPKGAFYAMPNVSSFYGKSWENYKIKNSMDLTNFLLEESKVAVAPGEAFGINDNIRIAYSNSMENIVKGMDALEEALKKLK